MRTFIPLLLSLVVPLVTASSEQHVLGPQPSDSRRPNIVFVLTDDQDLHMNSLEYMPYLQKHLLDQGTFYRRHFCTIALCCPSRVSLWTGKAAHNTNVTDVNPPYGGYPKFISQGFNDAYLPVWLQEAGYNTYYTGKLFNAHTVDNWNDPHPAGFNGSDFLLDPFTYQYLNASFQRNDEPPVSYEGQYSTDVLAGKAFGFLDDAVHSDRPFFLTIAPNAPHSNVKMPDGILAPPLDTDIIELTPPIPAERHKHLFKDVVVPRTLNFNPDEPSSVSWISKLPKQNQTNVDFNDHFYRNRLRALQAVDEMIDELVARLEAYDILDNTYIIYTTDNGYHIGQHRLQPGKECSFKEDINIPLVIRGPNVPGGVTTDIVTTHTDLVPTFFSLINEKLRPDFDGAAIPVTAESLQAARQTRHEHVNVEYWGFAITEGDHGKGVYLNNTYKALRVLSKGYNLHYQVWCSGEHELYDLNTDPGQLRNLHPAHSTSSVTTLLDLPLSKVIARLDALLLVLKSCKANTCIEPWKVLHPHGDVTDLWDALSAEFDVFYEEEQNRVSYSRCEYGYILDAEGAMEALVFKGSNRVSWSEFV